MSRVHQALIKPQRGQELELSRFKEEKGHAKAQTSQTISSPELGIRSAAPAPLKQETHTEPQTVSSAKSETGSAATATRLPAQKTRPQFHETRTEPRPKKLYREPGVKKCPCCQRIDGVPSNSIVRGWKHWLLVCIPIRAFRCTFCGKSFCVIGFRKQCSVAARLETEPFTMFLEPQDKRNFQQLIQEMTQTERTLIAEGKALGLDSLNPQSFSQPDGGLGLR
jgi:hypothetical protein